MTITAVGILQEIERTILANRDITQTDIDSSSILSILMQDNNQRYIQQQYCVDYLITEQAH